MYFGRIIVSRNRIVDRVDKPIFDKKNISLVTYNENLANIAENELQIIGNDRKVELRIMDIRFVRIYSDIMRFTGYLADDYKKYKKGLKVDVNGRTK